MADGQQSKVGMVVAGVAALAVAGFLFFKSGSDSSTSRGEEEVKVDNDTEEVVQLPLFLFVDSNLSQEQKEQKIAEWVDQAVDVLLTQNEDRKLPLTEMTLQEDDFNELTRIIENNIKIALFDEKKKLGEARQELIKENKFNEKRYFNQLKIDFEALDDMHEKAEKQVLDKVGISKLVMETSFETHIGDGEEINIDYIRKSMNHFFMYPVKNDISKSETEAQNLYKEITKAAIERFSKEDALGRFDSVGKYFQCLDQVSVDLAADKGLSEADFRALVLEHLSEKFIKETDEIYRLIEEDLNKQIEASEQLEKEKDAELLKRISTQNLELEKKQREFQKKKQAEEEEKKKEEEEKKKTETEEKKSELARSKTATQDVLKNVFSDMKRSGSFLQDEVSKFKISVVEFIKSDQMSADESPLEYGVMVQMKDSTQSLISGQKVASDNDPARTVFNVSQEFLMTDEETNSFFISLQDYEEEPIGNPEEITIEQFQKEGPTITITIKDNDRKKVGELKISGEMTQIAKSAQNKDTTAAEK